MIKIGVTRRHGKDMTNMKKFFALFLAAIMLFAALPTALLEEVPEQEEPVEEEREIPELNIEFNYEELTVGVPTPLTGYFFTSLWGNNTSDTDVRALLHGYDLIVWDGELGAFVPDDTVVSGLVVTENEATMDRTYTLSLYNDLRYSDGTAITAWDYAFSLLLTMAPEMAQLGGNIAIPNYLVGYEEYMDGSAGYLAGLHVIDDYTLAFQVKGEFLPFFYELGLLRVQPYPISVIAPTARVADDGNGVYFASPLNAAELQATLFGANGYMSYPSVVSGPYTLVSWDGNEAKFQVNPEFKGDSEGLKPSIQKITFRAMSGEEMINGLKDGSVTLINKITNAALIDEASLMANDYAIFGFTNYTRSGLGLISYNTQAAPMDDLNVRQALAQLIDRNAIMAETTGNYGLRAEGYYGLGQWMYLLLSGAIANPTEPPEEGATPQEIQEYEEEMEAWEELNLEDITPWEVDPEAAAALLDASGWAMGNDGLRYKDGAALALKLGYPEGSSAGAALEALPESLKAAGISLTVEAVPMAKLLPEYYGEADGDHDLIFMATNFETLFDLSAGFMTAADGSHIWKQSGLADEILWNEAQEMSHAEPGDLLTYCTHWLAFQERFAEVLPVLPIYSNVYFDFYSRILHDYVIEANISWAQAIDGATLEEYVEEEEGEEGEGEEAFE